MTIGQRIKEQRKVLKMSADELAERLGKNRATIYRYEKGEIENLPLDVLEPLAKALETTPAHLMGWDTPPPEAHEKSDAFQTALKRYRESQRKTLDEMASEWHISPELLRQYENGTKKIPLSIVRRLSEYLDIDISVLGGNEFDVHESEGTELEAATHLMEQTKKWNEAIGRVMFTDDELTELINFAKYIISKRNK